MIDKRTITVSGREIRWALSRKRVKNVNMRIKPNGIVYISAPSRIPISFIEDFIRKKADFIFTNLDRFASCVPEPRLPEADGSYRSGDTLRYLGTDYTLSIIESPIEGVRLGDGLILAAVKSPERAGAVLKKFYAEETEKLFTELNTRTYEMFRAKGYSLKQAELRIRKMTSRWGSCHIADRIVVMNSRLILYPRVCSEYVFIHEYAHFVVPNHSAVFYGVVADIMPDYRVCMNMLKQNNPNKE